VQLFLISITVFGQNYEFYNIFYVYKTFGKQFEAVITGEVSKQLRYDMVRFNITFMPLFLSITRTAMRWCLHLNAYRKEWLVICNEEDADGRTRVTADVKPSGFYM